MFALASGKEYEEQLLLQTLSAFLPFIEKRPDNELLCPNKKKRDHQSYSQIIL